MERVALWTLWVLIAILDSIASTYLAELIWEKSFFTDWQYWVISFPILLLALWLLQGMSSKSKDTKEVRNEL